MTRAARHWCVSSTLALAIVANTKSGSSQVLFHAEVLNPNDPLRSAHPPAAWDMRP